MRGIFLGALLSVAQLSHGCGIGWALPKSHFEGTDSQGHVMLGQTLGRLDLGKDLNLPIFALFDSSIGATSPYLGQGWQLPLLESRVVQIDENTFRMDQPDGLFRLFWKDKNAPNIYNGQGGWKAELRGGIITAVADCGDKLVFDRGRLISMQLKERKLDYVYTGNRVSEIKEGGVTVLRVEVAPVTNEVTGLLLEGKDRILLERVQRPRFQVVNGMTLVAAMDMSLSKFVRADGSQQIIEYPKPEGAKLIPSIKLGDRVVTWDPVTQRILKDGEWTYEIKPSEDPSATAAIKRTNTQAQSEFWHSDGAKGTETTQGVDGIKHVTSWFTSGNVAGQIRKIEEISLSNQSKAVRYSYNAKGDLVREVRSQSSQNDITIFHQRSFFNDIVVDAEVDADGGLLRAIVFKDGKVAEVYDKATYSGSTVLPWTESLRNQTLGGYDARNAPDRLVNLLSITKQL